MADVPSEPGSICFQVDHIVFNDRLDSQTLMLRHFGSKLGQALVDRRQALDEECANIVWRQRIQKIQAYRICDVNVT